MTPTATSWTDILTAIGTVGAVVLTLFTLSYKEWIEPWLRKARFSISLHPIYSFALSVSEIGLANPESAERFTAAKVRLLVNHIRGGSTDGAEILLSKMWKIEMGRRTEYEYFLPMNLVWSGQKEKVTQQHFSSGITRFVDLCTYAFNWEVDGWNLLIATSFKIGEPHTDKFSNVLPPGKYEFELLMSGENVQPEITRLSVEFDGGWSSDEKEMFDKHLKVRKII